MEARQPRHGHEAVTPLTAPECNMVRRDHVVEATVGGGVHICVRFLARFEAGWRDRDTDPHRPAGHGVFFCPNRSHDVMRSAGL